MIDILDIDSLLESQEKMVRGLRPGTEKKVSWAQGNGIKSKISIVFIHGFSAYNHPVNVTDTKVGML